ncbi:DUF3305 domain-containing protein [Piscinibacter sp.]|uniref:DUF3305 domain-containing protein n=1 Tax=Piscinibacter sp. TaxID=1903157 RepID=UPI001D50D948|nr:DUF3305 domain-containing protein [Piscinibacter sp.]MBK7529395.1 DUF3305 domain-containing protein [Piscinibacter sp.]MBL0092328.1 DUF3305 domain-containing protein [Piscinibacter sp.]
MTERPTVTVAVVMERDFQPNRWEDWRHRIAEVLPMQEAFGDAPRVLRDDGKLCSTLHPGLRVELFADEGEGYYLNLSSGAPVWFVVWRADDEDPSRAWPEQVTLSYNEAGRRLDAQERVDNVPLQPEWREWLQAFTDEHYKPEPKQRKRPASFESPQRRGS